MWSRMLNRVGDPGGSPHVHVPRSVSWDGLRLCLSESQCERPIGGLAPVRNRIETDRSG